MERSFSLPIISTFFGILIRMNSKDHNPPHFHAEYQGYKAVFEIKTGRLIAGDLPPTARRIVKEWTLMHKRELLSNWDLAQAGKLPFRIPGGDL